MVLPFEKALKKVFGRIGPQRWNEDKEDWDFSTGNNRGEYVTDRDTQQRIDTMNEKLDSLTDLITNQQSGAAKSHVQVENFPENQDVTITGDYPTQMLNYQQQALNVMRSEKLIFGAYWDKSSNSALTRIDDAFGLIANVGVDGELVQNDFDRMPIFGEIHEVEDEYGNRFMRIPKFYIQKNAGENHLIKRVSKTRYPGFYLPWVFWDFENDQELDYFDIGKYKASLDDSSRLESKHEEHPLVSQNIVEFRDYAMNNNDAAADVKGYQQLDIHAFDVLTTLFHVEFATLDSQSIMSGFTSGPYDDNHTVSLTESGVNRVVVESATADQFVVGQSISIGTSRGSTSVVYGRTLTAINEVDGTTKEMVFEGDPIDVTVGNVVWSSGWKNGFSANIAASSGSIGDNNSGNYPMMYRGIESLWGDIYQFIDGVNFNDNQAWVAKDAEDYTSNVFASPYEKLAYKNATTNGYPTEMGWDPHHPFAEFPVETGGSPSSYYADYYYQNTGQRIARVGGYWNNGSNAGLSYGYLTDSSAYAYVIVGGRLLKKAL